jgi:hypothetical protein
MPFFNFSFWQDFISNLGATIIGAGLGFYLALRLNDYIEARTEKERKRTILRQLKEELILNKEDLELWKEDRATKKPRFLTLVILMKDEAWRAFSDGGDLKWIKDPFLLGLLSGVYYYIKRINFYSEKAFQIHQTSLISEEVSGWTLQDYISQLSRAVDSALELMGIVIKEIENQVPEDSKK